LALIDTVENCVRTALGAVDVRCRVTARGVRLELGGDALEQVLAPISAIRATVVEIIAGSGRAFLGFAPYRRGSAFLRDQARV
jgi:uncharacterized protein